MGSYADKSVVLQVDEQEVVIDALLLGMSLSPHFQQLRQWARRTPELHDFPIDYHRLQLEKWVWDHHPKGRVMDVGTLIPRRWIGPGYFSLGLGDCDCIGDSLQLPIADSSLDFALCTEVLEHVTSPKRAVAELRRALRPGGVLLASSPFAWPWHGCDDYADYWRFTHQGWRLLLEQFSEVKLTACRWTEEGLSSIDIARRFEGWGFRNETAFTTGYLVEATK